jgi:Flp pilus assembly protein TadG
MIGRFFGDERGNYALMMVVAIVPIMGGLALAVDYTQMAKQRQETLNALDAAGIATARRIVEGVTDDEAKAYAKTFFEVNLGSVQPSNTTLTVVLPQNNTGGGTLKLSAALTYKPFFFPTFARLIGKGSGSNELDFAATSEVRLKNTLEVALVLDNSGSMDFLGTGSGEKRMDLLKNAAKQLVDTIAGQATLMKQLDKPVQFGVVPFAASVNVGAGYATAPWMDTTGVSPIHHENFDWTTIGATGSTKYVENLGGVRYARGTGWDAQKDKALTRFTLYDQMQRVATKTYVSQSECTGTYSNGTCYTHGSGASWGGCVESRPHPYNISDDAASTGTPATMFVPMFGPDETDLTDNQRPANNNWRKDAPITATANSAQRQRYMPKYWEKGTEDPSAYGAGAGPNVSCTTTAITSLTDVSKTAGQTAIKTAIDAMVANGATNVPEGMAWGWRVVSHGAPFTEGRPEADKGNDKVVIVLTDGANTYYPPDTVVAQEYSGPNWNYGGNDLAGSKAIYSALGYVKPYSNGYSYGRMFLGTTSDVSKTDYSKANYTKAMNEHFAKLCDNMKDNAGGTKQDKVIVMTVSLDLSTSNATEKAQIEALKKCASDSRYTNDETDPTKPKKLFWNTTGGELEKTFKEIADELSNLRIVG